ncbi:MAG TPA: DNA-3-methyladenine glycosylase 2 family protein [Bacteroidetes bacterium]|jgi:DNA-3-methyladenine glycosylase II|nr:MAG: hypothetical protein ABR95_09645 [Sphingobacteriales bacterium BACL12 MAG-120813-bin55]HCK22819.1 DNA-3-methyladenine glycosylase 2 family protein [Bacteroidota bacterium]
MDAYTFLAADDRLGQVVRAIGPLELTINREPWLYLTYSIMSQQLSTAVARTLRQRLDAMLGAHPTPAAIAAIPFDTLKSIGLSHAKTTYIKSVADFAMQQDMRFTTLQQMDDEGVIRYLIQINGVGRWTAEMLLMFSLGRPDVFASDDLGIRLAMQDLFSFRKASPADMRRKMTEKARHWSPYRTYACMYLWRWRDA